MAGLVRSSAALQVVVIPHRQYHHQADLSSIAGSYYCKLIMVYVKVPACTFEHPSCPGASAFDVNKSGVVRMLICGYPMMDMISRISKVAMNSS